MIWDVAGRNRPNLGNNVMKVGIATHDESRERTLAIAHGEHKPKADEPK